MQHSLPGLLCVAALGVSSCGDGSGVNPPTEPAQPIDTSAVAPPVAGGGVAHAMPGTGPASFVGRWAADASWCPNTSGEMQPILITPTRFEGYENGCDIASVDQIEAGYDARLMCVSEGSRRSERIRMSVDGQTMSLTYLDRGPGQRVSLLKCTTLEDTAVKTPSLID